MAIQIEQVDTRVAPDSVLEEMWHYYHEIFAEALPNDPPEPMARTIADWRWVDEEMEVPRWLLREHGEIHAVALAYVETVDNLQNGFGRIHVTRSRRGHGLARQLAVPLFEWLEDNGRTRFMTSVNEGGDLDPFLGRLGLKEAYHDQRSRLVLADVDRNQMRSWMERASERAADYELLFLAPPFPDGVIERYCDILLQMNTAPKEEVEEDDFTMTPERWRNREEVSARSGYCLHTVVAVHRPSGEFAASTTVRADLLDPATGWQWETVVHPEHREKGLGRWLKAAMIELLESEHPELERIDTENSVTNDAMLSINLSMGFKPVLREVFWQGDLAGVREGWGL